MQFVSTLLPQAAALVLVNAAIEAQAFDIESIARKSTIERAINHVRRTYPHYFKTDRIVFKEPSYRRRSPGCKVLKPRD